MKKFLILKILFTVAYLTHGQSVTLAPNAAGISTEGGMYYDNVNKVFKYWNGSAFVTLGGTSGLGWAPTGTHLYNTNTGNLGLGITNPSSKLTIMNSASNMLSLLNSNNLTSGTTNSLFFGGQNYTTGHISTIGTSNSAARMGFYTGYSFTGGASFLQERLTIANNGNVGVSQTNPQSTLDVGGSIRFSGVNPAAFVITATIGVNSFTNLNSAGGPTLITSPGYIETIRINHPMCNNNPNAIIMVTPQQSHFAAVQYYNGFWYLTPDLTPSFTLARAAVKANCTSISCFDALVITERSTSNFYDGLKYNILIIQN